MAQFSSLEVGKRALIAQRYNLDITGNNIANVNTPGYSRQSAVITETSPRQTSAGYTGTGVTVNTLQNYREEYFDKEVRSAKSKLSGYNYDERITKEIESALAEPTDNGLTEQLSDFFDSMEELANKPEGEGQRENFMSSAKSLVDRFHDVSSKINDMRREVADTARLDVTQVNKLLKDISQLNKDIGAVKAQTNNEASTLTDMRAQKIEELSKYAGVTVENQPNGWANIAINGVGVVTGPEANTIELQDSTTSATGETSMQIICKDSKGKEIGQIQPSSGELTSILKHYNTTLDDKDSSQGYSLPTKLNQLVNSLATSLNKIFNTGYGSSDKTSPSPNRDLFLPSKGALTASNIELNQEIVKDVGLIPTSAKPNEPGNNDVIRAAANLRNNQTFLNGSTPTEAYDTILTKMGAIAQEATNGQKASTLVNTQMTKQRDSVIGVDINEEAINLIKYQKAFEAASRIINITNELLGTVINLGR